ncbi:hypothetical protein BDZ91DRAFT_155753 [Kalaharituber pfeilii]|nr:hypothetical protein BDZ91DRAFT_155753 [Kalaharituber pfeilii]
MLSSQPCCITGIIFCCSRDCVGLGAYTKPSKILDPSFRTTESGTGPSPTQVVSATDLPMFLHFLSASPSLR